MEDQGDLVAISVVQEPLAFIMWMLAQADPGTAKWKLYLGGRGK